MTVDDDVELKLDNVVSRVRRKFDHPGLDLDHDRDFDSWKRRRTALQKTRDDTGDQGLREGDGQGVDDDSGPRSVVEKGFKFNFKNNVNHDCCSLPGGDRAGVLHDRGGQGDGVAGIFTVQTEKVQQRARRRVGSFLMSGDSPDNAAAAVGKLVLMGESHCTKTAP